MTSDTSTDASIGSSKTTLAMLGHSSVMRRWIDTQTPLLSEFPIGVDSLVRHCFKHEPPMPIELEHAIEITEDAVMPLAIRYAGDTELVLQGLGLVLIARALSAVGQMQISLKLEEVETLFNRMVAVSEGRPSSQEFLPTDGRLYAAILILRECMHHLHFANVTLQASGDPE